MITALLVDDEPKAIERLASLLESFPGMEVIGTARDVGDAERFLAGRAPDVVFLDINMPGRLGFDLVASVPAAARIVFVTAHDDRALDAFRAGAVDYLLKPVDRDRLAITIERLEAQLAGGRVAGPPAADRATTTLDREVTRAAVTTLRECGVDALADRPLEGLAGATQTVVCQVGEGPVREASAGISVRSHGGRRARPRSPSRAPA
jgi:DNA-binding LytR/AlgR family response regulator